MSLRKYLLGSAAACGALALVAPAQAQSSASLNAQIQSLQDQVRALNGQLQNLQSQVVQTQRNQAVTAETVTQMKTTPAPAAGPGGIVASMPNMRPTLSTADGQNTVSLVGRIHWDVGDYFGVHANNAHVGPTDLNSGENLRRARLGLQGKAFGDWNYALIYDFGGSTDNGPGTPGSTAAAASGGVETAELSYNGFRPLTIEGGIEDVPFTLDEATSSNDIMFIERSSSQVIAANLAAGDFRSNFGAHWNTDRLWLGGYFTGPATGTIHGITNGVAQEIGATQRATFQLLQSDQYSLHLGADAEELLKPETSGGVRVVTNFSDRPELRIDPTSILTTGTLGSVTNPVTGANVLGAELAGGLGSAFAQAEYFHYNVDRQGLSTASFNGGYVQASYTLTGEHRKYNPSTGAYSGISPAHPFDIGHFVNGAWGAVELGARYSVIDLNSNYNTGNVTSASSNAVAGGKQQVITIGANWYVNNNIRFMLDYLHGSISKPEGTAGVAGAPLGSNVGLKFNAIALRTQVAW
ncbi:MAG TPA: porin [Stellaceae bacterium]|jgi:phosphate-selective porin OprO/OprP